MDNEEKEMMEQNCRDILWLIRDKRLSYIGVYIDVSDLKHPYVLTGMHGTELLRGSFKRVKHAIEDFAMFRDFGGETRVMTDAGIISAYVNSDPENPGISMCLIPKSEIGNGTAGEIDLAMCEVPSKEVRDGHNEGIPKDAWERKGDIDVYTYDDPYSEDWQRTFRISKKDVEAALNQEVAE